MDANEGMHNPHQNVKVPIKEFTAKYSSKKECYQFCAFELKMYLPPLSCLSIYYLRELVQGKRDHLKVSVRIHLTGRFA